ncbi:hypothetical protein VW35_15715 [Devosia soli]|uniref:Uncharacterized protein n=1 Tax=Devosia soli TaxID=361041 RepID=A0A0F5L481_9HYPH|nr:hypothetical protein [Devosia soli]KKB77163.1 hypothetical protein VW35_15715 [Devosia soli]
MRFALGQKDPPPQKRIMPFWLEPDPASLQALARCPQHLAKACCKNKPEGFALAAGVLPA